MKYKYVIFQPPYDYYDITYHDIKNETNVQFINHYPAFGGVIAEKLCKLHRSAKSNSIVRLPFQSIWNPLFFRSKFSDNNHLCFLFSAGSAYLEKYGFVSYLKRRYPNAKFVCFYQDIVESVKTSRIEEIKSIFDLVLSYDIEDTRKYDLVFHNTVFSNYKVPEPNDYDFSDVYFVGAAKNRFQKILDIYKKLVDMSLKCDFYIIGLAKSEQIEGQGLHYVDGISYVENLKHVVRTKVVLEVMQKRATGASLRMWECINYDKIFLTNNEYAPNLSCYDSSNMHHISEIENIKQWIDIPCCYSKEQKESIRPIKLLEFIDEKL